MDLAEEYKAKYEELKKGLEEPKVLKPVKVDREKAQFKLKIEQVVYEEGEKVSKPSVQYMSPGSFLQFLKSGSRMGFTVEILEVAEGMDDKQTKQVNDAIDSFNKVQPSKKNGEKKNQIGKIKKSK